MFLQGFPYMHFSPFQQAQKNKPPQDTGLYIGNIDEAVSLEELYLLMKDYGDLKYIKLHRYPFLGISKNFAFVYYATPEQAQEAKQNLNHLQLLRKHLRITKLTQYDKDANLFFMGFPLEVTLLDVENFFSKYGPVVCIQFSYDQNDKSRGYGWVQFEKKVDAEEVVEKSKQEDLGYQGVNIKVLPFLKKGKDGREDQRNNIYVKNFWKTIDASVDLSKDLRELEQKMIEELQKIFSPFGEMGSIFVKIDYEKRQPFAFICFMNSLSARNAIAHFTKKGGDRDPMRTGDQLYVNWALTKSERKKRLEGTISDRYIYMENLRQDVTEVTIRMMLQEFGDIKLVKFDRIPMKQNARICYLIFCKAVDAQRLIRNFNKKDNIKNLFDNLMPIICHLFTPSWKKVLRHRLLYDQSQRQRFYPQQPMMPMPQQMPQQIPQQMGQQFGQQLGHQMPQQIPKSLQSKIPQIQGKTEMKYDQLPDLIDLLKNYDEFKDKPEEQQRKKLGAMLYKRIQLKKPELKQEDVSSIVSMLIDTDFGIDEILDLLKNEQELKERLVEAIELLQEDDDEQND